MAIFDSTKTQFLNFHIALIDQARVAELQALYPDGVVRAPYIAGPPAGGAAVEFEAPWRGSKLPAASTAPFSWSEWIGTADEGGPFPINVATFSRHTGGIFGLGGTTVKYTWKGAFELAPDPAGSAPIGEQGEIGRRRWIEGFETPGLGAAPYSGSSGVYFSKDASRHVGGMGLALRGAVGTLPVALNIFIPGLVTSQSWERFYIRLRKKPTATAFFWATSTFPSSLNGSVLGITPTGAIAVYTQSAVGVRTLAGTVAGVTLEEWTGLASHHAWVKIDILLDTDPAAATFRLFVNGILRASVGAVTATRHMSSMLGDISGAANDLYLDVDDWINADIPVRDVDGPGGPGLAEEKLNGKDWANGSKIALVRPTGFSGAHSTNWVGDFRVCLQNLGSTVVATPATLVSSTSGSLAAVTTDAEAVCDADAGALGVAAVLVVLDSTKGSANGTLGYALAGGGAVMAPIVQVAGTFTAAGAIYSAQTQTAAGAEPMYPDATPMELRHAKGADGTAASVASLQAHVEMNGKWGPEDYYPSELVGIDTDSMGGTGPHNYPYPRSPWAKIGLEPPTSPYIVTGGTYVGNGTGQDITVRTPVHFVYIRPRVGNTGGYWWLSTLIGSHRNFQQGVTAQIADAQEDPSFVGGVGETAQQQRYRIRIAGNDAQLNALGVTYQYIMVSDPGMRYTLNGVLSNKSTLPTRTHPLIAPDFTPEFAFVFAEDASSTTTIKLYAKAAGQAAAAIVGYSAGTVPDAVTFGAGSLETQPAFHNLASGVSTAYAVWRKHDGNQDTGEPRVVAFGSYTGDGTASRVITWGNPASGRRPMFAMIFAESGGTGFERDPSHVGTNSSTNSGADTPTGLVSGDVDTFTVGVSANGVGIVYTYFVLPSIADCIGNNGWGCNGENIPTEPTPPIGGPWTPPGGGPPGGGPTGPPGTTPPGPCPPSDPDCSGPEITIACAPGTTFLINRALSRIGTSKQIANILTDTGQDAATALLHLGGEVNRTLRDFPWPFATRWLALELVGGTSSVPVNGEWQYAYRRPGDCVFERRIAAARGGAVDPTPPPFELSQDDTGGLIYTNQASAYLEYTARPLCAAASVDPLFREALTWRLAAVLAVPLGRLQARAAECMAEYQRTLRQAEAIVRPGKPGPKSSTVDPDAATKLQIVNRGLLRIGARTITHYTNDQSKEAQAARLLFDVEYRSVLQDFPWPFATTYTSPVLAGGTASVPVNGDWQYSYTLPAAVVFARRLVTPGAGRRWDLNPLLFRSTGALLFTDETAPVLEYTALVSIGVTDVLFQDALAWRLAASLAPSLASIDAEQLEQLGRGPDPNAQTDPHRPRVSPASLLQIRARIADSAWQMYRSVLRQAEAASANQQQQDPEGDPDWIAGR